MLIEMGLLQVSIKNIQNFQTRVKAVAKKWQVINTALLLMVLLTISQAQITIYLCI